MCLDSSKNFGHWGSNKLPDRQHCTHVAIIQCWKNGTYSMWIHGERTLEACAWFPPLSSCAFLICWFCFVSFCCNKSHLTSTTICWVLWVLANHRNWWWSWESLTIHWQILPAFLSKYIVNMIIPHFLHCFYSCQNHYDLSSSWYSSPVSQFPLLHFLEHSKLIKMKTWPIPPLLKPSSDQTSHSKKKQSIYMTSVVWLLIAP